VSTIQSTNRSFRSDVLYVKEENGIVWMDGIMDGWMEEWDSVDGWIVWMDGLCGWMDGWMDYVDNPVVRMDGWQDRRLVQIKVHCRCTSVLVWVICRRIVRTIVY
jgi:hypothetical protein